MYKTRNIITVHINNNTSSFWPLNQGKIMTRDSLNTGVQNGHREIIYRQTHTDLTLTDGASTASLFLNNKVVEAIRVNSFIPATRNY
jgi:hypothetical protein